MNNDRLDPELLSGTNLPKPEVEIIVNGDRVLKPGMKTYFVGLDEDGEPKPEIHAGKTVYGTVCTCDTVEVCTCDTQTVNTCTCEAYVVCTCEVDIICACDTENVCTCNPHTFTTCTCNPEICTCVPVH